MHKITLIDKTILSALPGTVTEVSEVTGLGKTTVAYSLKKLFGISKVSASGEGRNRSYTRTEHHVDASVLHYSKERKPLNPHKRSPVKRDPFTEAFFGPAT